MNHNFIQCIFAMYLEYLWNLLLLVCGEEALSSYQLCCWCAKKKRVLRMLVIKT